MDNETPTFVRQLYKIEPLVFLRLRDVGWNVRVLKEEKYFGETQTCMSMNPAMKGMQQRYYS